MFQNNITQLTSYLHACIKCIASYKNLRANILSISYQLLVHTLAGTTIANFDKNKKQRRADNIPTIQYCELYIFDVISTNT